MQVEMLYRKKLHAFLYLVSMLFLHGCFAPELSKRASPPRENPSGFYLGRDGDAVIALWIYFDGDGRNPYRYAETRYLPRDLLFSGHVLQMERREGALDTSEDEILFIQDEYVASRFYHSGKEGMPWSVNGFGPELVERKLRAGGPRALFRLKEDRLTDGDFFLQRILSPPAGKVVKLSDVERMGGMIATGDGRFWVALFPHRKSAPEGWAREAKGAKKEKLISCMADLCDGNSQTEAPDLVGQAIWFFP